MARKFYEDDQDEKPPYADKSIKELAELYSKCVAQNDIAGSSNALDIERELFNRNHYITYTPQGEWVARKR